MRSCYKLSKKWTYCKKFPIVENRAQAFVTLWACYVLFCLFNVLLDWWLFCDSRNKNLHFRFLVFFFFLISFVDSFFQSFLMAFTRLKQNDRETFQNWDLSVVLTKDDNCYQDFFQFRPGIFKSLRIFCSRFSVFLTKSSC